MKKITQDNLNALQEAYEKLLACPCQSCAIGWCKDELQGCKDLGRWVNEQFPFIFSPLLRQVIDEFKENHSLSQTVIKETEK